MSLVIGDCRETMRRWVADGVRVQMCVTSPPYWGLRDYGTATWVGGVDEHCEHLAPPRGGISPATSIKQLTSAGTLRYQQIGVCDSCGAVRVDSQLGLEPTIAEYVANMVDVFRLVRELLADDGTLWLNLGDCYFSTPAGNRTPSGFSQIGGKRGATLLSAYNTQPKYFGDLKPKDLCGIPWRVAFALQADGWWLRQDIIWAKPNPMPESVTDRCTKAHEYLFLLSKRERYYFDAVAIQEPAMWPEGAGNVVSQGAPGFEIREGLHKVGPREVRNKRSVWAIATQPYAEAHFATFPRALVEPCVMAGSRVGDTVLDPFMGSGTVGQVAQDLGRKWLGCELSESYGKLVGKRTAQQGMVYA